MRALNAETRTLQEEVAQWEIKFHERVQEEIEERDQIEAGLKAHIRSLEMDAEEHAQKMRDLQIQLEASVEAVTATETVNDELEKRIDAITDLVGSPKKQEVVRLQTSPRRRHIRHKSMLPKFPTTNSLSLSLRGQDGFTPLTPSHTTQAAIEQQRVDSSLDNHTSQHDATLSLLTGTALEGCAEPSAELSDSLSSSSSTQRFSWSTNSEASNMSEQHMPPSTGKPSRRMRRFHATNMPKPLLLPSTASGIHNMPVTAPALERHESPSSFPFPGLPDVSEVSALGNLDMFMSPMPLPGRRRARTSAEGLTIEHDLASSPFALDATPGHSSSSASNLQLQSPMGGLSDATPRDFSSLGSAVGRNLFEELQRAKNDGDSDQTTEQREVSTSSVQTEKPTRPSRTNSHFHISPASSTLLRRRAWTCHQRAVSDQTGVHHQLISRTQATNDRDHNREDDVDTDRYAEADMAIARSGILMTLWRSFHNTARQSLLYAQTLTLRSATVQKLQWWLVRLFLGPETSMGRMMAGRFATPKARREGLRRISGFKSTGVARTPARDVGSEVRLRTGMKQGQGQGSLEWELERVASTASVSSHQQREQQEDEDEEERRQRPRHASRRTVHARHNDQWLARHSLWLWMRFSISMAFAVGAAIKDGPGVVMGVEEIEVLRDDEAER